MVLKLPLSTSDTICSNNTADGFFKWTKICPTFHHGATVASCFPKARSGSSGGGGRGAPGRTRPSRYTPALPVVD